MSAEPARELALAEARLRVLSYGGGVQSTAMLVLAARREIDFTTAVFANVGDDSEHPTTLRYVTEVAGPYAERHGIDLHAVTATRFGRPQTLLQAVERDNKSVPIPVRLQRTGAPGGRTCTQDFKVRPIARWMKQHGATETAPGVIGLGISLDEFHRMRSASTEPVYTLTYPLIDLRLRRTDCEQIIQHAGLPLPAKSACWFCPFHRLGTWTRMRRDERDLFDRSVALERALNAKLARAGKEPVYLTDRLVPLDQAIGDQMTLDEAMPDACASGFCEVS